MRVYQVQTWSGEEVVSLCTTCQQGHLACKALLSHAISSATKNNYFPVTHFAIVFYSSSTSMKRVSLWSLQNISVEGFLQLKLLIFVSEKQLKKITSHVSKFSVQILLFWKSYFFLVLQVFINFATQQQGISHSSQESPTVRQDHLPV